MRSIIKVVLVILLASTFSAQTPPAKVSVDDLKFLIGDWDAVGGGGPGAGKGGFSFTYELQNKVIIRRSYAEYPATADHPTTRHEDLMVIFIDNASNQIVADFFDTEGHNIKYIVTPSQDRKSVVFMSHASSSQPRYRLSYSSLNDNTLSGRFDIAPQGKPDDFKNYLQWSGRKK